jgi:hypothetical protein
MTTESSLHSARVDLASRRYFNALQMALADFQYIEECLRFFLTAAYAYVKTQVKDKLVVTLVAVVANPELRLLVLFADSVGLELIMLLLAMQLRSTISLALPLAQTLATLPCNCASRMGISALRAFHWALALRRLSRLVCPFLVLVSYGLCCRPSSRAA